MDTKLMKFLLQALKSWDGWDTESRDTIQYEDEKLLNEVVEQLASGELVIVPSQPVVNDTFPDALQVRDGSTGEVLYQGEDFPAPENIVGLSFDAYTGKWTVTYGAWSHTFRSTNRKGMYEELMGLGVDMPDSAVAVLSLLG